MSPRQSSVSEHEALQGYGNLQVSVSRLQEENTRLQQKVMRIEGEAQRSAALEEANRKLTQVSYRLMTTVCSSRFEVLAS